MVLSDKLKQQLKEKLKEFPGLFVRTNKDGINKSAANKVSGISSLSSGLKSKMIAEMNLKFPDIVKTFTAKIDLSVPSLPSIPGIPSIPTIPNVKDGIASLIGSWDSSAGSVSSSSAEKNIEHIEGKARVSPAWDKAGIQKISKLK